MDVGSKEARATAANKREDESYELLANKKHVVITEITTAKSKTATTEASATTGGESNGKQSIYKEEQKQKVNENSNNNDNTNATAKEAETEGEEKAKKRANENGGDDKFYVEEPFDFIFEPDHYPKPSDKKHKASDDDDDEEDEDILADSGHLGRFAQAIREDDSGVVEYEYKYYTNDRSFYTNKLNDDLDSLYFEGFNSFMHIRAGAHDSLVRACSMSRWPRVGFGFTLGAACIGADVLVYVNAIAADTPAELSSLRLGDIIIELDDESPVERFPADHADPQSLLACVNKYVEQRDNLHLVVVHDSHYARLKAETNDDLLKNHYFNCEDIVVVSLLKLHDESQIQSDKH